MSEQDKIAKATPNKKSGDTWTDDLPSPAQLLSEKQRQLDALREIAIALGTSMELDSLLRLVMRHVTALLDADRSTLYLIDRERNDMWSKVMQGETWMEIHLAIGQGLAGWVAAHGEILNIEQAELDPRFDPAVDVQTGYRTGSVLCLPVQNQSGQIIGVVQVLNKRRGAKFSQDDVDFLPVLAKQMAVAIDNAGLLAEALQRNRQLQKARDNLDRRVEELDLLLELQQSMSRSSSLAGQLRRALARTLSLVGADSGGIALRRQDSKQLRFVTVLGGESAKLRDLTIAEGQGLIGWSVQQQKSLRVDDASADPRHDNELSRDLNDRIKALLCVPLIDDETGVALGAIELLNREDGGVFTDADLRLLRLIAGQIAMAVKVNSEQKQREKNQRLESIGQMLASIVHDFKTPMTAISGYAELMALTDDAATRNDQSEVIIDHVTRLRDMVHDLLMFARGQTEVLLHKVGLDHFEKVLRQSLHEEFNKSNCHFTLEREGMGSVFMDEHKMLRALANVARNAIEAMNDQGGGRFSVQLKLHKKNLTILCDDEGPGIASAMHDRLFESFATHGKADGTGLGLAIVKKIVDEHHGQLQWASSSGGAHFEILIPVNVHGDLL